MIESSVMRRLLLNIFPVVLLLCPTLLNGLPAHRHAISKAETAQVLTLAAKAAAQSGKLPTGYCVATQLDSIKTIVESSKKVDGWSSDSPVAGYRLVVSSRLWQMPMQAIVAFPASARRPDCQHPLTFHEPEFVEVRQRSRTFVQAIVAIDDRCPLCGAGYSVSLKRYGAKWKVDPQVVAQTWIS